ncbi:Matrilin-4 Precursor [Channa argus]|uniref:Matrilin-4 n=1 Tax=Channa argus TaxID=215402 RepID=A0A6G1PMQ1_CHAAH|nr:Matrilin-4 Precursor [Channa argus]
MSSVPKLINAVVLLILLTALSDPEQYHLTSAELANDLDVMDDANMCIASAISVLMILICGMATYGAYKLRAAWIVPFFCYQIFDFALNTLVAISIVVYPNTIQDYLQQLPDNFPYKEEVASLSNVCLVFIVLLFISCILGFKAYLVACVWNCHRYVSGRGTSEILLYVTTNDTTQWCPPVSPTIASLFIQMATDVSPHVRMKSLVFGFLCLLCCNAVQLDKRRPRPIVARRQKETTAQIKGVEKPCKATPLDFVFVIDSSRSIRPNDFEKVKTFIINLLQFLKIGPDETRVGLLQYGSVVQPEFSLNTYTSKAEVEQAVRNMEHLATGTMTGLAIQYTMETAFTEEQGARPADVNIPRIAMIVTDGRPQDTVEEIAAEARQAGIQIFAIGVGRVDMTILKAIGSEPHSEHVHLVANFSQIETLISVFQSKLCGGLEMCEVVDHQCQHICVSSPASYRCKCRKGFILNPDGKTCKAEDMCAVVDHGCEHICANLPDGYECRCHPGKGYTLRSDGKTCKSLDLCQTVDHRCQHQCVSTTDSYICSCFEGFMLAEDGKSCKKCGDEVMDLVFVIDGSKSLGPANFELVKQFVNGIVDSLDISKAGTHVGLLQYSTKVQTEFTLGQYTTAQDIKQAVTEMQYMGRGSMTGSALRHMFESSFSAKEGGRPSTPHVSIVFTDGRSQDDVSEWATKAKNSGVTMYALGVGKAIEQELKEIASDPVEKHFYYAEDFEKMGEMTKKLKSRICKDEPSDKNMCQCENVIKFQNQVSEKLKNLVQTNILYLNSCQLHSCTTI